MKNILYIDNEVKRHAQFKSSFKNDFKIYCANSTAKGQCILSLEDISVIISNHRMPETTGIELFEALNKKKSPSIRILLTGKRDSKLALDAIKKGHAYQYLTKPYGEIELKETIKKAVQMYKINVRRNNFIQELIHEQKLTNNLISFEFHKKISQQLTYLKLILNDYGSESLLQELLDDLKGLRYKLIPASITKFGLYAAIKELMFKAKISPSAYNIQRTNSIYVVNRRLEIHVFKIVYYFMEHIIENGYTDFKLELESSKKITLTISYKLIQQNSDVQFENKISSIIKNYSGNFVIVKEKMKHLYQISYSII